MRFTPGLTFTDRGVRGSSANNALIIRGVNASATGLGSDIDTLFADTVTTYLGETPIYFNLQIKDIERVEVLRGPQGTLYGSGSLGGTVRFIPNRPEIGVSELEWDVSVGATEGSDALNSGVDLVANLPLGDRAALRISGGYERVGGVVDSANVFALDSAGRPIDATGIPFGEPVTFVDEDADEASVYGYRVAFGLEATNALRFDAFYQHQTDEADGQTAVTRRGAVAFGEYERGNFAREPLTREVDVVGLDVEWDLGRHTLSSASSYYENAAETVADFSGFYATSQPAFYPFTTRFYIPGYISTSESGFVQELRLASSGEDNFVDYVVGLYSLSQDSAFREVDIGPEIPDQELGPGSGASDVLFDLDRRFAFEDRAVFGELTFNLTDRLQVTGGARAFEQEFSTTQSTIFPFLRDLGVFFGAPFPEDEIAVIVPETTSEESDLIFKGNVSYALSDDHNLYLTYSEGFRRGGANGVPTIGPFAEDPILLSYGPDQVQNYEAGLKGTLGPVRFTVAAFLIDWDDIQIFTLAPNQSGEVVINGGQAQSRGIEAEFNVMVAAGLSVSGGYSYTDAALTEDFTVVTVVGADGNRLPGVSEHIATINVGYERPLATGLNLSLQLNGFYRSDFVTDIDASSAAFATLDGYSLWDAAVGVDGPSWSAALFVDNIFNEEGITSFASADTVGDFHTVDWITRPRTIGARLSHRLN